MAFRDDYGCTEEQFARGKDFEGTSIGLAYSDDGIKWDVTDKKILKIDNPEYKRAYDPRLTVIDGRCYVCFALDTEHGLRGGIAVTDDFENFETLTLTTPDNRNIVLLPEKVNGRYFRLERPMPVYSRWHKDWFDMWSSESPDLVYWGNSNLVMSVDEVPFASDKIGPGAPPVKTKEGWLTVFHSVELDTARGKHGWEKKWQKQYFAGIALLDLNNPSKVIGMSKKPLIAPELPYESDYGFRTDTVFPGGMILEDSGEVKIYYGAADTVECLATADVNDLLKLCLE